MARSVLDYLRGGLGSFQLYILPADADDSRNVACGPRTLYPGSKVSTLRATDLDLFSKTEDVLFRY